MKGAIYFIIGFLLFSVFYYDSVLEKPPMNIHLWRQADCLSITEKYYQGESFFQPSMHIQLADDNTSGKSAGEFPILYYIVSLIWQIFGKSYLAYRLFYLLILFLGLFSLFKSLQLLFNNTFWSLIITFLLFTSPAYVFYSVSFLTDAPAFSFSLMALYSFLLYNKSNKNKYLVFSMLLFALAGLIKTSSLIPFFVLFGLYLTQLIIPKSIISYSFFKNKTKEGIAFVSTLFLIFLWFKYAQYYNNLHGFKYTFNNIYPIWGEGDMEKSMEGIKNHTSHIFYNRTVLYSFLFMAISNLCFFKKAPFLFFTTLFTLTGTFFYFILWGPLFGVHDYYFIPFLSLVLGVVIPFVAFLFLNYKTVLQHKIVKTVAVTFLLVNFLYCVSMIKLKTGKKFANHLLIENTDLINLLTWTNNDVFTNWYRFIEMQSYLEKIGVDKHKKVISFPDQSFNISLYLMNRNGWTNFKNYNKKEEVDVLINKGAKFLLISDKEFLKKEFIQPYLNQKTGEFKGIEIFKLNNTQ